LDFHDGNFLIGVTLTETPITESYHSVESKNGKKFQNTGHLLGHIGCSAWANESPVGHNRRVATATKEEGEYYANKAYLRRLTLVIKSKQKALLDFDNLLPSKIEGLQSDLNKLIAFRNSIVEKIKSVPNISKKKSVRRESKWNVGDSIWTTDMAGHVFGTYMNFDGETGNCADRFSSTDFEVFDTIYTVLTDTIINLKIDSIRTWDCQGPEFLYKSKDNSEEHHEQLCFDTKEETEKFFKEFVFINRKKVSRQVVLIKYRAIIDTLLAGELTPKNRRQLELHKKKFATLT